MHNPGNRPLSIKKAATLTTPESLEPRQMLSAIGIFAAGVTNQETIELRINDRTVQTWENLGGDAYAGDLVHLQHWTDEYVTADDVKIAFVNDFYDPANGIDRNVRIDRIEIDGQTYQTEAPNVYSTGTWKPTDGHTPGFRQDEYLHSNGYFQYATAAHGGTTIELTARGQTGEEIMILEVDGNPVSQWQVDTHYNTYTYHSDATLGAHQVRVAFRNDAYNPETGYDRNLQVDHIKVDGQKYETESPQVFSTGTWKWEDGLQPGFRQNEFLHSPGYFQFAFATVPEVAQIDAVGNNQQNPGWGTPFDQFRRDADTHYADGLNVPARLDGPNARTVSNTISAQSESVENDRFITSVWFQWGQFLDHDIARGFTMDPSIPTEPFDITGAFGFDRSVYDTSTGIDSPRQQINHITAYIDGSVVYGSDSTRLGKLRAKWGGRMDSQQTSTGEMLPFNTQGLTNATPPSPHFFAAGDVRVNENVALTSMQTLWLREHNRIADELANNEFIGRDLTDPAVDEEIFQRARQKVMGLIQNITYREFIPSTMGFNAIPTYKGYNPDLNAQISNEFATAIYRLGHTTLPNELLIGSEGSEAMTLEEAFLNPRYILENGIDDIFAGIVRQPMQEVDQFVVDGVRTMLRDEGGGFDLVARNLQRGRDHGLPDYNTLRAGMNLSRVDSFYDVTSDTELAAKLEGLYGSPDNADPWVVVVSEDHVPGTSVGETIYTYMVDQFTRLRDGDRFYFENYLDADTVAEIKATRLSDVIERNTDLKVQDEVFWTPDTLVFRNGLDNEWLIRDFGDNGGAEVVFFGEQGIRDPNNREETIPVKRDEPINAVIVAGINEGSDGFFIPNALVPVPQANQGVDEFIITADIDFFEGYGLGGNDRWVIESDVENVFASGDAGTDIMASRSNLWGGEVKFTGGSGYDEITVLAPEQNDVWVDGGEDNDSIYVFTSRDSPLTVRGQDVPVIVTSGYDWNAPKVSSVHWSTDQLYAHLDSYYDLLSAYSWFEDSTDGWAKKLNQRFNQEFADDANLPRDMDVRHFWSGY